MPTGLAAWEGGAENAFMSVVRKDVLSLSVTARLQLIEEIWDSLAATPEAIPVTDAQRKELARRRRAHARNPSAAKSWDEVRARLERRK
jgi:putative addiction module component (TIGR02574 family)